MDLGLSQDVAKIDNVEGWSSSGVRILPPVRVIASPMVGCAGRAWSSILASVAGSSVPCRLPVDTSGIWIASPLGVWCSGSIPGSLVDSRSPKKRFHASSSSSVGVLPVSGAPWWSLSVSIGPELDPGCPWCGGRSGVACVPLLGCSCWSVGLFLGGGVHQCSPRQ